MNRPSFVGMPAYPVAVARLVGDNDNDFWCAVFPSSDRHACMHALSDLRRIHEGFRGGAAVSRAVLRAHGGVPRPRSAQGSGGRSLDVLEGMGNLRDYVPLIEAPPAFESSFRFLSWYTFEGRGSVLKIFGGHCWGRRPLFRFA